MRRPLARSCVDFGGGAAGQRLHRRRDLLHEPVEHGARPHLDEERVGMRAAIALDSSRPPHRRRELLERADARARRRVVHRLARSRSRRPGSADRRTCARSSASREPVGARLHERRVECAADVEPDRALGAGLLASSIARSTPADFAADHDLPGAVVVRRARRGRPRASPRSQSSSIGRRRSPRMAAIAPGRFDCPLSNISSPRRRTSAHRVGERERAGGVIRRELAERVAGGGDDAARRSRRARRPTRRRRARAARAARCA